MNPTTTITEPERLEFLGDIITTAVEGGTNYWAQVSQYQWIDRDGTVNVTVGVRWGNQPHATLHEVDDAAGVGYKDDALELTVDAVQEGLRKILEGDVKVRPTMHADIARAVAELDAGEIDDDLADTIVQAALLGELRYG